MSIYFVEVLQRAYNTFDYEVIFSYPFPDVPISEEPLTIENFIEQIKLIPEEQQRIASLNKMHFIMNNWHTKMPLQLALRSWKYERK